MKIIKKIAPLMFAVGLIKAAEPLEIWKANLLQIRGKSWARNIEEAYQDLYNYEKEPDEDTAQAWYQEMRKKYNPRILDQTKRPLFDDVYAELNDLKLWREFLRDDLLLQHEHDENAAEKLYEQLLEKYQKGPKNQSIQRRLARLSDTMRAKRRDNLQQGEPLFLDFDEGNERGDPQAGGDDAGEGDERDDDD